MGHWVMAAALVAMLAGCGSFDGTVPNDPARDVLGVSASQPAAGEEKPTGIEAKTAQTLEWKVGQLCTRGYDQPRADVERAQNEIALVDWKLSCRPYELTIFGVSLANR